MLTTTLLQCSLVRRIFWRVLRPAGRVHGTAAASGGSGGIEPFPKNFMNLRLSVIISSFASIDTSLKCMCLVSSEP